MPARVLGTIQCDAQGCMEATYAEATVQALWGERFGPVPRPGQQVTLNWIVPAGWILEQSGSYHRFVCPKCRGSSK